MPDLLDRLASGALRSRRVRRTGPGRAARMVAGQRARRLCRRHGRAEPDATLSRPADRAGRSAARPRRWYSPRPMRSCRSTASNIRSSPIAGAAASTARRAICCWRAFTSTARSRCGASLAAAASSSIASGWSRAPTRSMPRGGSRAIRSTPAAELSVHFLANGRDHHGETWPPGFNPEIAADGAALAVTVPGRFA